MTPDIREKAERLWREELGFANDRFGSISIISQALLEAHNAGREEERERCVEIAEHYEVYLAAADMRNPGFTVAKLAAIRSIK